LPKGHDSYNPFGPPISPNPPVLTISCFMSEVIEMQAKIQGHTHCLKPRTMLSCIAESKDC
jgi:hypothetical protein